VMLEIPEVILVPLTKSEALLVLDALSRYHATQQDESDEQINTYSHIVDKISARLDEGQNTEDQDTPHLVR
jgi:hypothetical protein